MGRQDRQLTGDEPAGDESPVDEPLPDDNETPIEEGEEDSGLEPTRGRKRRKGRGRLRAGGKARERIRAARYLFPNGITSLSLAFALSSIYASIGGQFEWAGWLIVWCALLDKADGAVARLLRATSEFGLQMDSLVDLVAFGVAPAVLGYTALLHTGGQAAAPLITAGASIFYVICVAGRLAHFNTTVDDQSDSFRGIPSTLGGAVLAGGFLIWATNGPGAELVLRATTSGFVVLGILMVAPLRLPKVKKRKSMAMNVFTGVAAAAAYVFGFSRTMPELLFVLAMGYLVFGLIIGTTPQIRERRRARATARAEAEAEAE